MTGPLELSLDEVAAATAALKIPGGMGYNDREHLVATVVDAINRLRCGDPVGTLRRSVSGNVAVKVREQEAAWRVVVPDFVGGHMNSKSVVDWDVIYLPEQP